jgi:hypothetical protein
VDPKRGKSAAGRTEGGQVKKDEEIVRSNRERKGEEHEKSSRMEKKR